MGERDTTQVMQEFVQLIRGCNLASTVPLLARDAGLASPGPRAVLPGAGEYLGSPGGVQDDVAFARGLEITGGELQAFVAQGDKVALVGRHRARLRTTGKAYELSWVQVWTFREV